MSGQFGQRTDDIYATAGFGARVHRGTRPVIVVVDLTLGFTQARFASGCDLSAVVGATRQLLDAGRQAGVPVVFTAIAYTAAEAAGDAVTWLVKAPGMRLLREGSEAVAVDSSLGQRPDEILVVKKGASAFFGTSLAATLVGLRCDTVVLCGATTSGCVRASVVDAVQSGFPVLVPRECVGDRAPGPHEASLYDLDAKYADVISLGDAIGYLARVPVRTVATP